MTALAVVASDTSPIQSSHVGLELVPGLSFVEWVRVGAELQRHHSGLQWAIGDWLRYEDGKYGDAYADAIGLTGYDYQSLARFKRIAIKYEIKHRRLISWSHHLEAAGEEQEAWLDRAESNGWSKHELRRQVQAAKRGDGMAPKPGGDSKKPSKSQTPDGDFKGKPSRVDPNKVLVKMVDGLEQYVETIGRLSEDRLEDISELSQRGRGAAATIRTFFKRHCK